eukprot:10583271-Karenia_brevis.AAC.1
MYLAAPFAARVAPAMAWAVFCQRLLLPVVFIPPVPTEIGCQRLSAKACEPGFLPALNLRVVGTMRLRLALAANKADQITDR